MAGLQSSVNDLATACSRSVDAAEWEEFVRRCTPLASLVALRVSRLWLSGPSTTAVDDIVQEVFLKLCEQERRILADFEPRGEDSFLGLLSTVAASVANDYFRRHFSAKRGGKVVISGLEDLEFQGSTTSAPFGPTDASICASGPTGSKASVGARDCGRARPRVFLALLPRRLYG